MPRDFNNEDELARDFAAPHGTDPVLETLAGAQSIFDSVCQHLARQGMPSVLPVKGCAYRGPDGLKCAVGFLLRDEELYPEIEGRTADMVDLPPRLRPHVKLLVDLQLAHDEHTTGAELVRALKWAARNHGLSSAVLDGLAFPAVWRVINGRLDPAALSKAGV